MEPQHARANQARLNMIEQQIRPWDVLDQRVLDVLGEISREHFLNPRFHGVAYSDHAMPIGHDQTMLPPNVDGRLLQALALKNTDSVLEIGTGSGYLAACLSRMCRVLETVEISEPLAAEATQRLSDLAFSNVEVKHLDASNEWDAADAYDAIAFSGAIPSIPDFYRNKMAIGGRLFAIIGSTRQPAMEAVLSTRLSETEWMTDSLFETLAPPLLNFDGEPEAKFEF